VKFGSAFHPFNLEIDTHLMNRQRPSQHQRQLLPTRFDDLLATPRPLALLEREGCHEKRAAVEEGDDGKDFWDDGRSAASGEEGQKGLLREGRDVGGRGGGRGDGRGV
jgi:hypothetical protein